MGRIFLPNVKGPVPSSRGAREGTVIWVAFSGLEARRSPAVPGMPSQPQPVSFSTQVGFGALLLGAEAIAEFDELIARTMGRRSCGMTRCAIFP
ncbi:hypothetical protein BGK67_33460 [Streptomyces subrutilus]|uniref:Uncharacterized protein n=1 Tax=Streptomyces subrutilus TaxID=36818 RepID=A0A1E5P053_9ACTN|nr:hypothetical protein BGK67_33460 [Streptomyces subrutilus]